MGAIRQTLISKDIISFKKTLNAYIYSIIKMNSNYYNGVSEITYPKIAGLSDISEGIIKAHLSEKDEKGKFVFKDNPLFLGWEYFYVNGILFNHESERRGETFVTRKITLAAARIAQGLQDKLYLGNLNSLRDWGYAKDYVECMWLILQHDTPEDFVIATGEYHTVREFTTLAFKEAGIELRWEGEGVDEKGIDVLTGKVLVEVDPKYFRPAEVEQLLGDPTKARELLGWNPRKTSFPELVKIMVDHDMKFVKKLHMKELMNDE